LEHFCVMYEKVDHEGTILFMSGSLADQISSAREEMALRKHD
jgi:hypothetical protein